MSLINDSFIDRLVANVGNEGHAYYYDFHKARKFDREAHLTCERVNGFLDVFRKFGGESVTSTEQLTKILNASTDLFNEPATDDNFMRVRREKQDAEKGIKHDNVVDFFAVRLDRLQTQELETFLQALRPCLIELGPPQYKGSAEFPGSGLFAKIYHYRPVFFGDKFSIKSGELITTTTYAEDRDKMCSRYIVNDDQRKRLKIALDFWTPFRELARTMPADSEAVRMKSFVSEIGLPFPLCIVQVSADRRKILPNVEYIEGISLYPKPRKVASYPAYSPYSTK